MTPPEFSTLFIASKGTPIAYNGKTLIMADKIPARLGERFLVTIEATDSLYPQGVGCSNTVRVFDVQVKRAVVWEYFSLAPEERGRQKSRLPFSFEVECRNRDGHLLFYNMTEYAGRQEWWTRGHCMVASDVEGGRRYHCNDVEPDDDFNDLIFSVVRLGEPRLHTD